MRLTDIMQHADLAFWAQVAFVLFGVSFVAICGRVLLSKRSFNEKMSSMPLQEEGVGEDDGVLVGGEGAANGRA
ncbi:MAG: hypothetical protein AAF108_06460 [Planctomycetota bacterium]